MQTCQKTLLRGIFCSDLAAIIAFCRKYHMTSSSASVLQTHTFLYLQRVRSCRHENRNSVITYGSLLLYIHLSGICLLSVTFMHPTKGVEVLGNISPPLCTLAILCTPCKILWRLSQGNPSVWVVKHKRVTNTTILDLSKATCTCIIYQVMLWL